jgi:glycosyltransferase involved in cell wall biosynthesis
MIIVNARFLTQKVTGVQRFAMALAKIMNEQLHNKLLFVAPHNIIHPELASELKAVIIGRNTGTFWEQFDLRYYLLTHNFPLLISFCNTGLLFYKKQLVTIHDMSYKVNPKWFSRRFCNWYNFLIPNIARHSLQVLTVSNSSKNDLIFYLKIPADKISVIYNSSSFVSNDNFEPKYAVKYLLTVSSIDARKNLSSLIKAFSNIPQDTKLYIVGLKDSNFVFDLNENLLKDNIIVKGYITDDELKKLMINAAAFIYVSFYEGFGLPPIEAMSMGCPVIVSDIPAHKEVCGEAAIYVDPYDVNDIEQKIIYVLTHDTVRKDLIEAGKKNVKRFNWFDSAQKVVHIINEIS